MQLDIEHVLVAVIPPLGVILGSVLAYVSGLLRRVAQRSLIIGCCVVPTPKTLSKYPEHTSLLRTLYSRSKVTVFRSRSVRRLLKYCDYIVGVEHLNSKFISVEQLPEILDEYDQKTEQGEDDE